MSNCGCQNTENLKTLVLKSLKCFKDEIFELYLPKKVPIVTEIPEPLEFYRKCVAPNLPVLIKGGAKKWPALKKWDKKYMCQTLKNKMISVAVTPNGYADAITETVINQKKVEVFALPEERLMTISDFFDKLDNSILGSGSGIHNKEDGIFYIQKQNSNLIEEFPELLPDIDEHLLWASETFESKPVAINLWVGDKRAVTSLHKDPFENIYCVISGSKEFILFPPTDRPWLSYKKVPVGQYKEVNPGEFNLKLLNSKEWMTKSSYPDEKNVCDSSNNEKNFVPWILDDPSCPNLNKYPLFKYATPLKVKVEKGDMLYIPSLWFHYVTQSHGCIAVNYWYDMSVDIKYAYYQLLENLAKCIEQ